MHRICGLAFAMLAGNIWKLIRHILILSDYFENILQNYKSRSEFLAFVNDTNESGSNSLSGDFSQKFRFSDGAAYQHSQMIRHLSWFVSLVIYACLNSFYLRIVSGSYFQLKGPYESRYLIDQLQFPLHIFQFPSWIVISALFMCLLCAIPIIISQLYNLIYTIPFVLSIMLLGHKPVLCFCVFFSCALVSFEPLRFKSKYVASLLSLLPVVLFWWLYSGSNPEQDVLRWAVFYAPWGFAFLFCLIFLGIVVIGGHFTRYWPGILPPIILVAVGLTIVYFNHAIGLDERDFQAQVYRYRPDKNTDFKSDNIVPYLMKELKEIKKKQEYLSDEAIMTALRTEWKWTFNYNILENTSPTSIARKKLVNFEQARLKAIQQIDVFIEEHSSHLLQDSRLVDAIYFKGLLNDLRPDIRAISDEDILRFYYDSPSSFSQPIWQELVDRFGDSIVSIDARRRLALLAAMRQPQRPDEIFGFDEATRLLDEALLTLESAKQATSIRYRSDQFWYERFKTLFTPPSPSIGHDELIRLETKMKALKGLISSENRTGHRIHDTRLAAFIGLDPHRLEYEEKLLELLNNSPNPDPLRDNIEFALAQLKTKEEDRIARFKEIIREFPDSDGAHNAAFLLETLTNLNGK